MAHFILDWPNKRNPYKACRDQVQVNTLIWDFMGSEHSAEFGRMGYLNTPLPVNCGRGSGLSGKFPGQPDDCSDTRASVQQSVQIAGRLFRKMRSLQGHCIFPLPIGYGIAYPIAL